MLSLKINRGGSDMYYTMLRMWSEAMMPLNIIQFFDYYCNFECGYSDIEAGMPDLKREKPYVQQEIID